jgi:hypothetical protein
MQLLTATVKSQPRTVTTKYGERSVMDVVLPNGEEQSIWGPANFSAIVNCRNGQPVAIAVDSKGKYHVVEGQSEPVKTSATEVPPVAMTTDQKRAIAQYVQDQRDLLAFCLDQAATIPQAQTDDSVEKLGVTLYLSAQRKFKLA